MKAAIDNLKQKPREHKTAVAGGVAIGVVALLLVSWAFFFLKKITARPNFVDVPSDPYSFKSIPDIIDEHMADDLMKAREEARHDGDTAKAPFGEPGDLSKANVSD